MDFEDHMHSAAASNLTAVETLTYLHTDLGTSADFYISISVNQCSSGLGLQYPALHFESPVFGQDRHLVRPISAVDSGGQSLRPL